MNNITRTLITIITESSIEKKLTFDIENLGAKGYTVSEARGKGHRGIRDGEWDANANVRIEVICDQKTADRILNDLQERYYKNFAMIIYTHPVNILRPDKF